MPDGIGLHYWGDKGDGTLVPLEKLSGPHGHVMNARGPEDATYGGKRNWAAWECETCGVYADDRDVLTHPDEDRMANV